MNKVHPEGKVSNQPEMTEMTMQPQLAMQPPKAVQPQMVAAQSQMLMEPAADHPLNTIPGYAISGFEDVAIMSPPSYQEATNRASRQEIKKPTDISEDEARAALANHVSEHCCYGKKPLVEMKIHDLKTSSGYHYTLETFTEYRSARWSFEPFIGQDIDGPQNGQAPGPWDIPVSIPKDFCNEKIHLEVPHTASVKRCPESFATGRVRCKDCDGTGKKTCHSCYGQGIQESYSDGESSRYPCGVCGGSGNVPCGCMNGMVLCPWCEGKAQLKVYIKLTIEWINHVLESLIEKSSNLPNEELKRVSGHVALEETLPRVQAIEHCEEVEVNNDSHKLIQKHKFKDCRILKQRQKLRVIPVTKCIYKWKETTSDYVVYGLESQVYAPNYPQQCCWGCTVL